MLSSKKLLNFVLAFLFITFVGYGCASRNDVGLMNAYVDGNTKHMNSEAVRIGGQSQAMAKAGECPDCTPSERALLGVIVSGEIAKLKPIEYGIESPTLGTDVQDTGIKEVKHIGGKVVQIVGIREMGDAVKTALKNSGDRTTIGDGNTLQDSNRKVVVNQEVHSTAIAKDDGVATPSVDNPSADIADRKQDTDNPITQVVEPEPEPEPEEPVD